MAQVDEQFVVRRGDPELVGIPEVQMFGFEHHRGAEQRLTAHYNPGIEICYCKTGVYRWNVEGELAEIRPGELSVTRPWQVHSGHNNVVGPGQLYWVIIATDEEDVPENLDPSTVTASKAHSLDTSFLTPLLGPDAGDIVATLRQTTDCFLGRIERAPELIRVVQSELSSRNLGRRTAVRAALAELLVLVARRLQEVAHAAGANTGGKPYREAAYGGRVPEGVLKVLSAVAEQPAAEWTAESMADGAGLGQTAFTEWCRRVTGRSPRWYVLEQRLERGRELLADPSVRVTEVAYETGFSSSQHFSSAFRKLYGESPSAYRARRV